MATQRVEVAVDYHQFYLWDAAANPRAPEDYTPEDVARMVKVTQNVVVIQPVRNGLVPFELNLCGADPGIDLEEWDHVVEGGLELPHGELQVAECLGRAVVDLRTRPGTYVFRAKFRGLGSLSQDGLEGDDFYAADLWPDFSSELRVLKAWRPAV